MPKRVLLLSERNDSAEVLARELRARDLTIETTDSVNRVRERVEAGDIDEIVIDARTVPPAEAVARKIRSMRPQCHVVMIRSATGTGRPDVIDDPATFRIRADRLAELLADATPPDPESFAIESDRLIKVLEVLVGLLEVDDAYYGGFSSQVARLSSEVGRTMGLDKLALDEIVTAALLRDIGRVGVRREVLEGKSRFTKVEQEHMEHHVEWGVRLLEHIEFGGKILPIIRHHHERYDGTGYPDGLKGREIPLGARIIHATESFAAMVSERPHRPAKSFDRAIEELMANAGTQFDPEIVECLAGILDTDAIAGMIGRRARIYIFDEENEFRRLLRMRLLNEGFEVRALGELTDGVELPDSDAPCLVLADTGDDARDLFVTMERLQADEHAARIPIAVLARADNRAVKLEALRHGIEDFILKSDDLEEVTARVRNILTRERRRRRGRAQRREGVVGRLENLSVADLMQMLCMGNKTACVHISSAAGVATVFVRDGDIVHAECDDLVGQDAFRRVLSMRSGDFRIVHGVLPEVVTIESSPMHLLMDAAIAIDADRDDAATQLSLPEDPMEGASAPSAPPEPPPAPESPRASDSTDPRKPFIIRPTEPDGAGPAASAEGAVPGD